MKHIYIYKYFYKHFNISKITLKIKKRPLPLLYFSMVYRPRCSRNWTFFITAVCSRSHWCLSLSLSVYSQTHEWHWKALCDRWAVWNNTPRTTNSPDGRHSWIVLYLRLMKPSVMYEELAAAATCAVWWEHM